MQGCISRKILNIILLFCAVFGGAASVRANWSYTYDTAWLDDFEPGTPGEQPGQWLDASNGGRRVEMAYSYQGSYATLTRAVEAGYIAGDVYSENIRCNVDIYDTLEIRVVDSTATETTKWRIGLQESGGDQRYYALHNFFGATGTFSFRIRDHTNWTGMQDFKVCIEVKGEIGEYLLIDYVSIFRNPTDKNYLWREDFIGPPDESIRSWWDENDDIGLDAKIFYSDSTFASHGNVRLVELPWGKVLSPSIYWDRDRFNFLEIQVTDVALDTAWKVVVLNPNVDEEYVVIQDSQTHGETGIYTYDMLKVSGWVWDDSALLSVALVVEGAEVGANYDVDYIRIYQHQPTPTPVGGPPTPSPTVGIFPEGCFVTPNPFLPQRGERIFFNFQMPGAQDAYAIRIMNLQGRTVKTLANCNTWDGRDNQGRLCEGGIYVYQIEGLGRRISGKLVLLQ